MRNRTRPRRRPKPRKTFHLGSAIITTLQVGFFLAAITFAAGTYFTYRTVMRYVRELPSMERLESYEPNLVTQIYAADGSVLGEFFEEQRILVNIDQIPPDLVNAFIAIEDHRFWEHWGLDLWNIAGSMLDNVLAGKIVRGASTITQQLARDLFLTKEVSWARKIKEALLAVKIERRYTKEEILGFYLNQIYFGHGAYGVEAAARRFFGKSVREINLAEASLIAGIIKSPKHYSPINNFSEARKRQRLVLLAMHQNKLAGRAEVAKAWRTPLQIRRTVERQSRAPYFLEYIRRTLEEKHGSQILYRDGVKVFTSLDPKLQSIAEEELERRLVDLETSQEYPIKKAAIDSGVVTGMSDATRYIQGAFVVLHPQTGHVLALIGGRDFNQSQYNRATQARRQPGSGFKPFVYATAIEQGLTPISRIYDTAVVLEAGDGELWTPSNFDSTFHGETLLRTGLALSRNMIAIKVLIKVGVNNVVSLARRLGIKSSLPQVESLAIGTGEVSLLELVSAYTVFANGGYYNEPIFITRITDREGRIIEENRPQPREVLSPEVAYMMTNLLSSVIRFGTGQLVHRAYGFDRPAAGKTGTTDNQTDAWFTGYTPYYAAGCWVGFDLLESLGKRQTGAVVALPIWANFMRRAHEDLTLIDFPIPPGIIHKQLCRESYQLATENCRDTLWETFIDGTEPESPCHIHGPILAGAGFNHDWLRQAQRRFSDRDLDF